jgi:ketosteroid isomerase-like protein
MSQRMRLPVIASVLLGLGMGLLARQTDGAETAAAGEKAVIEKAIRASIHWAVTKDRALLESLLAHDDRLFIFNPDAHSTVGWNQFKKGFEFWMDPRFKMMHYEIRNLRLDLSLSGTVAWWSCILDELASWDGRSIGWKDTRWTGVIEKRGGRWLIVQMHFSHARN